MKNIIFNFIITATALLTPVAALAEEKAPPIKVACVGDSITFGFGIKNRDTLSYPAQLAGALGDGWAVRNFGRNGRTALKQGHASYWDTQEYKAALSFKPNIVIIKLGTNDLRAMNWEEHKAEYVPDYVDLIRSFQDLESKPRIWVCYPVPVYPGNEKFKFGNDLMKNELIPKIDEIAKQTGVNVIDLNTALSGKKNMFPDNIHPNAEGAKEIATAVSIAITKEVSARAKPADAN